MDPPLPPPRQTEPKTEGRRRCAACKYLRRRCSDDCILAPHFHPSNPNKFARVHKIFGASNVARILRHLPEHKRAQAAEAMAWEAYWRVQDPIYGCSSKIARLQDEIRRTKSELAMTRAQVAFHRDSVQQHNHDEHNQPAYEDAGWATDDGPLLLPDLPPDFF
ncbi:LOB domain-containing protein 12 [Platanthera guangdongensis]|uniref:LOB domain-containing protein 12 n=1 Tax=Platanthera guangdongensis TaxID=2320717 RepID=A0ABR2LKS3_9ASPA